MASTYSGRYRETTPVMGSSSTSTTRPLSPMRRPKSRALRPTSADVQGQADGGLDVDELADQGHHQESHQGAVGERLPVPHRLVRLRVRAS